MTTDVLEKLDILEAFEAVDVTDNNNFSEEDHEYFSKQEASFKRTAELFEKTLKRLKELFEEDGEESYRHDSFGYVSKYDHIRKVESHLEGMKNTFINRIFAYVSDKYNVKVSTREVKDRYDLSVTYKDVLDEIMEQLDGLTFNERAVQEIRDDFVRDLGYSAKKAKVKKKKITMTSYLYQDSYSWSGARLSYNARGSLVKLFKAFNLFENGSTELPYYLSNLASDISNMDHGNAFNTHQIPLSKVKSIRLYKNARIDINFKSSELALQFMNEYIKIANM